jgi:hypothetical protein
MCPFPQNGIPEDLQNRNGESVQPKLTLSPTRVSEAAAGINRVREVWMNIQLDSKLKETSLDEN